MKQAVQQNQFLLGYAKNLTDDLPDERWTEQPFPGINHPAWIIGHLANTADSGVTMVGGQKAGKPEWANLFKGGTTVTSDRSAYPSKEELLNWFNGQYETLQKLSLAATEERLNAPNIHPRLKTLMPTNREVITFLLSSHLAIHLGQLSMWRRLIGLPPLF